MSSDLELPTISDLLAVFGAEARSRREISDVRSGALYDVAAGMGALLWARMSGRDRDLFRVCYFDGATEADLDDRILTFDGPARVESTRGAGYAVIRRATSAGGAGTLWAGTRLWVTGAGTIRPRAYMVVSDTAIGATALGATVSIQAEEYGTGVGIDTSKLSAPRMTWPDALWDATWEIAQIVCWDGTDRESDSDYLARYRQDKVDKRRGYVTAITDACLAAGAGQVALFESDYISPDDGINRCFVGDAGFQSTTDLLRRCRVAVDSARVLGCDLTVFGMTKQLCTFDLTLHLWDDPGRYNQDAVRMEAIAAVQRYFDGTSNPYVYRFDGIRGELSRSVPDLQSIVVNTGPADTTISSILAAESLARLYTDPGAITITLEGPE
jgi:hypothetical protein